MNTETEGLQERYKELRRDEIWARMSDEGSYTAARRALDCFVLALIGDGAGGRPESGVLRDAVAKEIGRIYYPLLRDDVKVSRFREAAMEAAALLGAGGLSRKHASEIAYFLRHPQLGGEAKRERLASLVERLGAGEGAGGEARASGTTSPCGARTVGG